MHLPTTRTSAARTLAAGMWPTANSAGARLSGVPRLRCLLLAQSRRTLSTTTSPSETSELKSKARFSRPLGHKGNVAHVPTQAQPVPAAASGKKPDTKKTQRELDEELRQRMEGISGEGGASGVEYEDGRPASMKRSVRENMFRYI